MSLGLIDPDHPPLSLAPGIIALAEEYLVVPTGLGAGGRLVLSAEQCELLWAWYSVTPNGRRFVHDRKLILRMAKGWAKSPIGAVDMFAGLVGDVVPDGLDANGAPVGRPHPSPWLQVAANSEDQTDNLFAQCVEMLRNSPAVDDFGLDVGITRIRLRDRPGVIEPVTASAGAREGQPISGAALEETHLMRTSNGGVALAATITRNAIKMAARILELTNAYVPGANSVAERSERRITEGRGGGVLFLCREAHEVDDLRDPDQVRPAVEYVYGGVSRTQGGWVDVDRIVSEITEAGDDEQSAMRRYYLNQVVAPEEAPVDLSKWEALADRAAKLEPGDTIAIGFDGSETRDASALYAVRWPDWTLFPLGIWERPTDDLGHVVKDWKVPTAEVKDRIRWACQTYRVVRGYADDAGGWRTDVDELNGELGASFMAFPHRIDTRIGPACERFSAMVAQGALKHTGEMTLPRHIANARRVPIGRAEGGWYRPARRTEGQPTDAFSAAVSAVHALGDAVAHDEVAPKKPVFFAY